MHLCSAARTLARWRIAATASRIQWNSMEWLIKVHVMFALLPQSKFMIVRQVKTNKELQQN